MSAEEIREFLESDDLARETSYSISTLTRAAEKMFTARGLTCPIVFIKRNRKIYIIRREAMPDNAKP